MTNSRFRTLVAILAFLTLAPPAEAGWLNATLRELGWGWSDGYHAPRGEQAPPGIYSTNPQFVPSAEPLSAKFGRSQIVPPSRMSRPSAPPGSFR